MISDRQNNFGFLRLLFASLVIVSHSPELVDGNRSREILTRLLGTMSFGEVAVSGFFLISGYLVTQSFMRSESTLNYLTKRVLRIVPGYIVSLLLCVVLVAPFVGNSAILSFRGLEILAPQMLTLSPPGVAGVFTGLPYPILNGAMWTISYEFRCYIATAILGLLGIYRPRWRMLLVLGVAVLLALDTSGSTRAIQMHHAMLLGSPQWDIRFAGVFGVGAVYYLFHDKIPLTDAGAAIAAIMLTGLMFNRSLAETAFAIFGGYLILWFSFKVRVLRLSRFDNNVDISYGMYLYGWPIQSLIIWNDRTVNPWALCFLSLLAASLMGYVSWTLVEKPCLRLARSQPVVFASP